MRKSTENSYRDADDHKAPTVPSVPCGVLLLLGFSYGAGRGQSRMQSEEFNAAMIEDVISLFALNELRIDYEAGGVFRFTSPTQFHAKSIGVTVVDGGPVVWWIVSAEYSDTSWTPNGGAVVETLDQDRVRKSLRNRDSANQRMDEGDRELRAVMYGVIPDGFIQITPELGQVAPLERGRTYEITAMGNQFGALTFVAD